MNINMSNHLLAVKTIQTLLRGIYQSADDRYTPTQSTLATACPAAATSWCRGLGFPCPSPCQLWREERNSSTRTTFTTRCCSDRLFASSIARLTIAPHRIPTHKHHRLPFAPPDIPSPETLAPQSTTSLPEPRALLRDSLETTSTTSLTSHTSTIPLPNTAAMSNAPTLINLPPPPSDPVTPSDVP